MWLHTYDATAAGKFKDIRNYSDIMIREERPPEYNMSVLNLYIF